MSKFFICINAKPVGFADNRKAAESLVLKLRPKNSGRISAALPGVDAIVIDLQTEGGRDYALRAAEDALAELQLRGQVCTLKRAEDLA